MTTWADQFIPPPKTRRGIVGLAQRALPLMNAAARSKAVQLLNEEPFEQFLARAAEAWEDDMQPVRTALAAALHGNYPDALDGLRRLLPGLLREVNRAPSLVAVLIAGMGRAFFAGFDASPLATLATNAISLPDETQVTDALRQWRSREVFETDLSSAELRGFSRELRNRSIFSARTTNADYVQEIGNVVDEMLSGKINQGEGRLRLLRKLKELGYDPATGFPGDMANIPPAERDSLQDLSSQRRLDLVLETNVRMAANYGRMIAGNSDYERREYPAWQLVRNFSRHIERGSAESHTEGWARRWHDAGDAANWEGAITNPLVARKDSPIWQALGDGDGGYIDTLGNPFPPFAFRSGMGWRAVPRAEAIVLGVVGPFAIPAPMKATLAPSESSIVKVFEGLSPELQEELRRELAELQ